MRSHLRVPRVGRETESPITAVTCLHDASQPLASASARSIAGAAGVAGRGTSGDRYVAGGIASAVATRRTDAIVSIAVGGAGAGLTCQLTLPRPSNSPERLSVLATAAKSGTVPSGAAVRATETAGCAGSRYRPRSRSVKFRRPPCGLATPSRISPEGGRDAAQNRAIA